MYRLSTKDMTAAQREAWWRSQAEDAYHDAKQRIKKADSVYMSGRQKTATGFTADKRISTHKGDEWYRQSSYPGAWRI
jgi:hypothetical protein